MLWVDATWAKVLAVLLGVLLWWPLVPSASTLARGGHDSAARADVDDGGATRSEQTPLGASEQQVEDFTGEDSETEASCTSAPAHLLDANWTCIEFFAYECPCIPAGYDRFGRQRAPPMA
jgi:hypothetical protein